MFRRGTVWRKYVVWDNVASSSASCTAQTYTLNGAPKPLAFRQASGVLVDFIRDGIDIALRYSAADRSMRHMQLGRRFREAQVTSRGVEGRESGQRRQSARDRPSMSDTHRLCTNIRLSSNEVQRSFATQEISLQTSPEVIMSKTHVCLNAFDRLEPAFALPACP